MNRHVQALLLRLAKPLLHVHLEIYRRDVNSAPFPLGEAECEIAGESPDRLAFIGSIAVSGYGVLHHGMKTSSRTAERVAATRGGGATWVEVTSPTLTAAKAVRTKSIVPWGTDAVVILLGITDVLLVTKTTSWRADLERLIEHIRYEAGSETAVVIAGIPPMAEFREIPPVAARLLTRQTDSLNAASQELAERTPGVVYVPFPKWDVGELFIQDALSWATMHKLWAKAIAPAVVGLLGSRTRATADERRSALLTASPQRGRTRPAEARASRPSSRR